MKKKIESHTMIPSSAKKKMEKKKQRKKQNKKVHPEQETNCDDVYKYQRCRYLRDMVNAVDEIKETCESSAVIRED